MAQAATQTLTPIEFTPIQTRLTADEEQAVLRVLREGETWATGAEGQAFEAEFTQFLYEGPSDWLRVPVKLDSHLSGFISGLSMADAAPTTAMYELFDQLSGLVDAQLSRLEAVIEKDVLEFNERVSRAQLPAICA